MNLNPRSLYNKADEFRTLVDQSEAGIVCVSETWDRSNSDGLLISEAIEIENYHWIKNVTQRKRSGGKPAILVSKDLFHVTELCPDIITVPINVEVVWALLTPKEGYITSGTKHIAVASVYYSSTQTKRADLVDHICEAYHILNSKYGSNLGFMHALYESPYTLPPLKRMKMLEVPLQTI